MTTASRAREAAKAAILFHAALVALGVRVAIEALQLWADVSPTRLESSTDKWLGQATNHVNFRRRDARDLAFRYYRLTRALRTGYTIPSLEDEEEEAKPAETRAAPRFIPLGDLRDDFYDKVQELTPDVLKQEGGGPKSSSADDERIVIEEIDKLREDEEEAAVAADEEARVVLAALGSVGVAKRLKVIDTDAPAQKVDSERQDALRTSGARVAAAAARVAMNGGRQGIQRLGDKDTRAIGWVRLSRTGTPCGWCAMLISRGPVYRSKKSAGGEDTQFHDNCNCYVEQVFTDEQYDEAMFDLNREYADLWPKVTKGKSGKEALAVWRRHFREQQRKNPRPGDEVPLP